jgi:hypothetical protein
MNRAKVVVLEHHLSVAKTGAARPYAPRRRCVLQREMGSRSMMVGNISGERRWFTTIT